MFIKGVIKQRKNESGQMERSVYFRLCESYRTSEGKVGQRMIMGLGYLPQIPLWQEKQELCRCLNTLVIEKSHPLCDNPVILSLAYRFYEELSESGRIRGILREETRLRREEELRKALYTSVKLGTMTNDDAREIGAEHVCLSTLKKLGIGTLLKKKGWNDEDIRFALMQIASRAIYPYSELKTSSFLKDNSALAEMLHIQTGKITKDRLYESANRLYAIHRELEDWLYNRVRTLFKTEDKILLFDLSNTYFEGRMCGSRIARFGRSKEKRSDCKIVVLAAVVNTEGLLVRTEIYEGNTSDCRTLEDIIHSLDKTPSNTGTKKKTVVMDAGISTAANLAFLRGNGYDYITVSRSGSIPYTSGIEETIAVTDNRGQQVFLERVHVENHQDTFLLVSSHAKSLKETAMYERAKQLFEDGLKAIEEGLQKKGGTKKRDRVNERIGRLKGRFPFIHNLYDIRLEYNEKGDAISMAWTKDLSRSKEKESKHGKYLLQTSLDEKKEENIWMFYNVIRTVEQTFRILKTDLDIRPVYHKKDDGIKAHLHLAILAYWIVSSVRYQLKKKGINSQWDELLRILSTQKIVSTKVEKEDNCQIRIRQCTEPQVMVVRIYEILLLEKYPLKKRKFVWHPEIPPEKNTS